MGVPLILPAGTSIPSPRLWPEPLAPWWASTSMAGPCPARARWARRCRSPPARWRI